MHGFAKRGKKSRTYRIWCSMKSRCTNPNVPCYKNYGDRGITYSARWASFWNFYTDMGEAPDSLTLERRDNNQNYSKENCCWATRAAQARNKRNNRKPDGKTCLQDIAMQHSIEPHTLRSRLENGVPLEEAIQRGAGSGWRRSRLRRAAETAGMNFSTVTGRVKRGMSEADALATPLYADLKKPRGPRKSQPPK